MSLYIFQCFVVWDNKYNRIAGLLPVSSIVRSLKGFMGDQGLFELIC
jgi:hypothetical protein